MGFWNRRIKIGGKRAAPSPQTRGARSPATDDGDAAAALSQGAGDEERLAAIRRLIASGADPTALRVGGMTPLHWAANRGHIEAAKLLLEHGADANARGAYGETPLLMALSFRWNAVEHPQLIRLLAAHGADIGLTNDDGWFPLYAAAASGFREAARVLIELGADVDQRTSFGQTALDRAGLEKHESVARLLAEYGGTGEASGPPSGTNRDRPR